MARQQRMQVDDRDYYLDLGGVTGTDESRRTSSAVLWYWRFMSKVIVQWLPEDGINRSCFWRYHYYRFAPGRSLWNSTTGSRSASECQVISVAREAALKSRKRTFNRKGTLVMPTELVWLGGVLVAVGGAIVFALIRRTKAVEFPHFR